MDPYMIISADCHAGLPTEQYRPYVDPAHRQAFDDLLEERAKGAATGALKMFSTEFAEKWLEDNAEGISGGWDSAQRDKELDGDGVAGEIIFPDADAVTGFTGAPFNAGLGSTGRLDPQLALAGARAHNRWLAELCGESPQRRAGVAIIPILDDPVEAVGEITAAAEAGLRGGILIPAMWAPYPSYQDRRYDPVWAACQDLDMPVHTHSGPASHEDYGPFAGIYLTEVRWWASRPLAFLIWSGVFEHFPRLKFGVTESNCYWAPDLLWLMDTRYTQRYHSQKLSREAIRHDLTMLPSEYFDRNCFVGATTIERRELARRYEIGVGNILWGNDFPHPEGTWPNTRGWLKHVFADIPVEETRKMLGTNAAAIYNFDTDALAPLVARIGPTPEQFGQNDEANVAKWEAAAIEGRHWISGAEAHFMPVSTQV